MRSETGFALAGLAVGMLSSAAHASLSLTTFGAAVVEDFNSFAGAGFSAAPGAGQLDSNTWRVTGLSDGDGTFGGEFTAGDFARGTSGGGVTSGGMYAFEVGAGDFTLGVQPTGSDWTPGDITLRVQNDTGGTITQIDLDYDVYVYNDATRGNSFNFAWSLDDVDYTAVDALDLVSPADADPAPAWVQNGRSTSISGLSLAAGEVMYLRWTGSDMDGAGSRDEFGLDNVSVTAVPAPGGLGVLVLAGLGMRRRRRR